MSGPLNFSTNPLTRVAIIGCGKMAEQHAANIRKIPGFEIVGVCDREPLMAQQLAEHFNIALIFDTVEELLDKTAPEIVHITTPPHSHHSLGMLCLKAGCHVMMEKPFTLNAEEAEELLNAASIEKRQITVGHNALFSHAAIRLRELVRQGFLGSKVVHLDSIFCYDLGGKTFAGAFLSDKKHWVRRLPGKLLQNIISHGIAQISEYLEDETVDVKAVGFSSPFLLSLGEEDIVDELRVILRGSRGTTAYFTFSSQLGPRLHQFRVFGDKNALVLDDDHQTVTKLKGRSFKGQINQLAPPIGFAGQHLGNAFRNFATFLMGNLHGDARTRLLIESFYRSVKEGAPPPISHREILRTARIMDEIFRQVSSLQGDTAESPADLFAGHSL